MIRLLVLCYNNVPAMLSGHSLLALLDHLDPGKYEFFVAFNRSCDLEEEVARRGIGTAVFPHGGGNPLLRGWQYGRLPVDLWRLARRYRPAVIYADNAMAGRDGALLKALTGLPLVVHLRNVGWFARTGAFVRRADRFAAVSAATVEGTLPPMLKERASVVLDGIDLRRFPPVTTERREAARRELGIPSDRLVVAMAARLSPQKGQLPFLDAARRLCEVRDDVLFVHAGKIPVESSADPYERHLASEGKGLVESGRLRWREYMDRIEVFWAAADVAVLPSTSAEALGLVLLEAMASGVPVVSTASGGPEEIILSPEEGSLVAPGDGEALAGAIKAFLDDPALRSRVGTAGRRRVERTFSAPAYAERMSRVFEGVAGRRG